MTGTDFPTGVERPIFRQTTQINEGSSLPDPTGHAGDVLTTDGTSFFWTPSTGTGTVTSVAATVPSGVMSVAGSPVTGAGTLDFTFDSQSAGKVLASPASTSGVPTLRVLVPSDIPLLAATKINSGVLDTARLGSGTADSTTYLRGDSTWQTPPVGVTSVALTMPSGLFSTGGSPITSTGTFAVTLDSQAQNLVLASPDGSSGLPSARALVSADIPNLAFTKITGTVPVNQGGTGQTTANTALNALLPSQTGNSGKFLTTDATNTSWVTITPGTGTVTSVAATVPSILTISGSPVTTSGTLAFGLASAAPNTFLSGPDGTSGTPTFRVPVVADLPALPTSKITSGVFGTAFLGTGTADSTKFLRGDGTWQLNPLGTVTSVALSVPGEFSVSGTPITTAGTLAITTTAQTANTVWAGPTSGSAAQPGFRALGATDIPTLDAAKIGTGTFTASQISSLDTSKITTGVFAAGLLPTIAINAGGTGTTTANGAFNALVPSQTSNAGKILTTDGTNTSWTSPTTTSPAGSTTQLQYNNAGSFGAITGVTSDGTKLTSLTAAGTVSLNASGSSATNINTGSSTGAVNMGNSSNTSGMSFITKGNFDRILYTDTVSSFSYLGRNYLKKASGTVSTGFGTADAYYADTDTSSDRIMGGTIWEWTDATDATRSSKLSLLITKNGVPAPKFTFNQDGEFGIAGSSSGILSIKAAAATSTHTLTFPDTQGGSATFLKNDGSGNLTWDTPAGSGGDMILASVQTVTGAKTFGGVGAVGKFILAGSTSGTTILNAAATAGSGTVVLPTTGTLATLAGTETFTNKTLTSPVLTTPDIGVATATTVNKVTITAPATSATLTLTDGKTLAVTNTLTLSGTDSTTMTFPSTTATIARKDAAQTFTGVQTFSSTIVGSVNGNAATVTNATLSTALTVNTGTLTLTANAANTSVLTVGAGAVSVSGANTGDQTSVTGNAGTATALQTARTIGGTSFDGTANITVASATGGFTVSGGDLALSANNITLTGSIGATGARVTKVWATDMQVTNAIAGSVTGNAATATALANARTIGGTSFDGTANITVATATGGFTVSGGDLALGANNITLTGSIGATGSRSTKGWFTNLEVTNAPTVGGSAVYYTGGTDVAIADGGTGAGTANTAFNALAPSQTSNSGKYLTTDGTNTSWATVSGSGSTNNVMPTSRLATTAALPTNTYLLGVLTGVSTGTLTVDGVVTAVSDILTVKDEATGANNGLYTVTTAGAIGVAYILTRHTSMDAAGEFVGAVLPIGAEGTTNKNTEWRCTNATAPTVGTTAITFAIQNTGVVPVANGGTGAATLTAHGVVLGNTTSAVNVSSAGTAGQVFISGGASADPAFSSSFIGMSVAVYKSGDETVTSSATLQNDDELTFTIAANEVWKGSIILPITANASGGFKLDMTAPSGATGNMRGMQGANPFGFVSTTIGTGFGNTAAFTNHVVYILNFTISNSSNAGSVTLRWAQNASFGTGTVVQAGAFLHAIRTA